MTPIDTRRELDALIAKYEAIPDDQWITGSYTDGGRCCAVGHLGVRHHIVTVGGTEVREATRTVEAENMETLLHCYRATLGHLVAHNDDLQSYGDVPVVGNTPKARVLNFLRALRERGPVL